LIKTHRGKEYIKQRCTSITKIVTTLQEVIMNDKRLTRERAQIAWKQRENRFIVSKNCQLIVWRTLAVRECWEAKI